MGRVTGGDLVIELKQDVMDLKRSFSEMEHRMQTALNEVQSSLSTLGEVVREGFSAVEKSLDRFVVHLDAHTESLGELTAKVNDHEDRLTALESKSA